MLWLLERKPAPKLDQISESLRRWRGKEKTYAIPLRGWCTIDGILSFGIKINAVFCVQHADEGSIGGFENAALWHVDALPLPRRDPAPTLLRDAHFIDQVPANLCPIPL